MKRGFVQPKDRYWPRSTRRSLGRHLPIIVIEVPVSQLVKFLVLGLPILFLLISSFFMPSPFASADLNLRTSASLVDREAIGQIQLRAPPPLEELLQSQHQGRKLTANTKLHYRD